MQLRRCGILAFESREALDFDLATLFAYRPPAFSSMTTMAE